MSAAVEMAAKSPVETADGAATPDAAGASESGASPTSTETARAGTGRPSRRRHRLELADELRVDGAAVADDDVVGARQLVDLADDEVLHARAGDASPASRGTRRSAARSPSWRCAAGCGRCCRPRGGPRARSAQQRARQTRAASTAMNGPATITPTKSTQGADADRAPLTARSTATAPSTTARPTR